MTERYISRVRWLNRKGSERFLQFYSPDWGKWFDVPSVHDAPALTLDLTTEEARYIVYRLQRTTTPPNDHTQIVIDDVVRRLTALLDY